MKWKCGHSHDKAHPCLKVETTSWSVLDLFELLYPREREYAFAIQLQCILQCCCLGVKKTCADLIKIFVFQDLLLDIRKHSTLDEALDSFFSRERLEDLGYKCEACNKKVCNNIIWTKKNLDYET